MAIRERRGRQKQGQTRTAAPTHRGLAQLAEGAPQVRGLQSLQRMADGRAAKPARSGVVQRFGGPKNEVKLKNTVKRYKSAMTKDEDDPNRNKKRIAQDAIAARKILRDLGGTVSKALQQLEQDINAQWKMSKAEEPNSRHLTRALAVREKQCGLGSAVSNYTRLLSADDFTSQARKGALFNDYGALVAAMTHGEFTHRIQWYILMFGMSGGFSANIAAEPPKGFHFTPKDLLININLGGVELEHEDVGDSGVRPTNQKEGHTLWDVLFDRSGLGNGGMDIKDKDIGVTDPERLMLMLDDRSPEVAPKAYREIFGHLSKNAPALSHIVSKRTRLRRQQAKDSKFNTNDLDTEAYEKRKLATGRYHMEGEGILVRDEPQSLVGSLARGETHVPYAKDVEI